MPISVQTEAEEGGVEDIISLVDMEEITPSGDVALDVPPRITKSGMLLNKGTIKIKIH